MAPVGRWQQGRDLQWYAKSGDKGAKASSQQQNEARKARVEELRNIKEAENDALSAALGFAVVRRQTGAELSSAEVERAIKDSGEGQPENESEGKGVGFGSIGLRAMNWGSNQEKDILEGRK